MAAPIMDYIQYINNLPICDATTREILNEYIEILNKIIGSEHEHDAYITKEIMEGLYLTKKEFNTIDFNEKIDLSNHVSKEELNSFNYLTASYNGFCTLTDANKKLDDLKQYITDTLKKYALKSDLDLIKDFLNRLEIRIKNLEDDNKRVIEEIEALKAIVMYTIQYEIDENIVNTNNITVIKEGKSYSTVLTCDIAHTLGLVQVLMNNVDITAQCVSKTNTKAMIDIPSVTGPIIIRAYALFMYSITKNIPNCSITNTNDSIAHGSRYYAQIAANLDYVIVNATLTMGEENVSNMYMSNTEVGGLEIDIPNVTGDIIITVETEEILPAEEYQITYYLIGGVASDTRQTVYHGDSYYTEVTVTESTLEVYNYQLIMDGADVTSKYMTASNKKVIVNIPYVTGHINVRVETHKEETVVLCTGISASDITVDINTSRPVSYICSPITCNEQLYVESLTFANTSIAKKEGIANVEGVSPGTTTATLTMKGSVSGQTFSDTFNVHVTAPCTSLTCNGAMTLGVGADANLNVNVQPSNIVDSVHWEVSDSSALSVYKSSGGYWVHAVKPGNYTVTLYCGNRVATCRVTIKNNEIKCTHIEFSPSSISVNVSQGSWNCAQYLMLTPSNTTDTVEWYTNATDGFSVIQNGKISFSKVGTYRVQARCNGLSATLNVKII